MAYPLAIVYELEASRNSAWPEGRYQSLWMDDFDELDALLIENWDFFEQDGRHNIWFASAENPKQIIYDQHEIIYIYGAEDDLLPKLKQEGFSEGEAKIPSPHLHCFHPQFDDAFESLMTGYEWSYSQQ